MAILKQRLLRLGVHLRRHPYLFALIGFIGGIASFALVERQDDMAGLIALFMLASWLLLVLETPVRKLMKWLFRLDMPPSLVRFTTQLVHQESYFFVLPFFLITTTWASSQVIFTALLILAALISIIDPIYYGWLARRRWLFLAYHALALFVLLLTALPIIFHLSTPDSYAIATVVSVLFALPSLLRAIPVGGVKGAASLMAMVVVLGSAAWLGRAAVAPATLWLTEGSITHTVDRQQKSAGEGRQQFNVAQLTEQGIFAYTAIRAPLGLNERIYHQWRHQGQIVDQIPLDIHGGREDGYRAWTRKESFPADPRGQWQVRVKTEAGQQVGQLRFTVTD
ncbi:MAG: DUF2914 domain-containing protein [Halomonadaceae bacterium]|nr:MAG: DUF2914 domain-containing protein [Halomonadaceae bacterium]